MLKGCLVTAGLAVTGLLVASCAATPESAVTEIAAQAALVAATQIAADATQPSTPAAVATAVQPALAKGTSYIFTPKYIVIIYPSGQRLYVPRHTEDPPIK